MIEVLKDITEKKKTVEAEEELKESEEKFGSLVEHSLAGVYLIQDGVFKYVNPRLAEIFGYSPEELIGKKGSQDFTYPEDWPIVKENLRKRLDGEVKSVNYTFRCMKKNGKVFDVEVFRSRIIYKGTHFDPRVVEAFLRVLQREEVHVK